MDKSITPSSLSNKKVVSSRATDTPKVSEKTLAFLRLFASNYFVEKQLPQGMQGIILG